MSGSLLLGVLFTGYFATEYNYIGDVIMHENQTEFYYSLNLGVSHVSAVMATVVGSIYYDLTMNLRAATVTSLSIVVIGNLLYSLRYSVFLVIIGDAMILCLTAAIVTVVAEVAHVYEEAEMTAKMGVVCAFKTVGMLIGPCLALVYTRVDVPLNDWKLDSGNLPAVVLGSLCLMYTLIILLFGKDLAKMYDLKANRELEKHRRQDHIREVSNYYMEQVVANDIACDIVSPSDKNCRHFQDEQQNTDDELDDSKCERRMSNAAPTRKELDINIAAEVNAVQTALSFDQNTKRDKTSTLKEYMFTALKLLVNRR